MTKTGKAQGQRDRMFRVNIRRRVRGIKKRW